MDSLLVFLDEVSKIPTCENPALLKVILFFKIIIDVVRIVLPIGLIIFMMIDFTRCIMKGNDSEQSTIINVSFKRIFYAILVFAVPYMIKVVVNIVDNSADSYNSCLLNATEVNIPIFEERYEAAVKKDKENWREKVSQNLQNADNNISNKNEQKTNSPGTSGNLSQFDSRWGNYPVCLAGKTIGSSGCGYVAYTMVVRHFGYSNVTPPDIVKIACDEYHYNYSAASIYFLTSDLLNNRYGLKAEYIYQSYSSNPDAAKAIKISKVEAALKQGKVMIVQMPGHYISLLGLRSDGTVIVGDSSRGLDTKGPFTVAQLYETTKNPLGNCAGNGDCGWTNIMAYSKK